MRPVLQMIKIHPPPQSRSWTLSQNYWYQYPTIIFDDPIWFQTDHLVLRNWHEPPRMIRRICSSPQMKPATHIDQQQSELKCFSQWRKGYELPWRRLSDLTRRLSEYYEIESHQIKKHSNMQFDPPGIHVRSLSIDLLISMFYIAPLGTCISCRHD